jgi:carbon monoxide dehydrogenase subunit G
MTAEEAFHYMADLTNFPEWDPGLRHVEQVDGEGPGLGASFDLEIPTGPRTITLRYVTEEFEEPSRVVVRARNSWLTSLDVVTVSADESGTVVTYDAELTLNGPLKLADPLLAPSFRSIGDRAAAGLIRVLQGERVAEPVG